MLMQPQANRISTRCCVPAECLGWIRHSAIQGHRNRNRCSSTISEDGDCISVSWDSDRRHSFGRISFSNARATQSPRLIYHKCTGHPIYLQTLLFLMSIGYGIVPIAVSVIISEPGSCCYCLLLDVRSHPLDLSLRKSGALLAESDPDGRIGITWNQYLRSLRHL